MAALAETNRLLLKAPTGSGKSTQVPQMILDAEPCGTPEHIVVLQPRRMAARLLAGFVAAQRGGAVGDEVGYQIRLENKTSRRTRIEFLTEGVLLRRMLSNPNLNGITTLILDEFHERHLYADVLLARAVQVQKNRTDLRLIVMSATLDIQGIQDYLEYGHVISASGKQYPVEIDYLKDRRKKYAGPVWESALSAFQELDRNGLKGDTLIFMPGMYEIIKTVQAVRREYSERQLVVLPLHGQLPAHEQNAALADYDRPKVVVSTNVAETSLTIPGIRHIIDSGLARIAKHDPANSMNSLTIQNISIAAADQRAGRAGRTAPGTCIRLWTEQEHKGRALFDVPEIQRVELSEIFLLIAAQGVDDFSAFPWLDAPDRKATEQAVELLRDLGALNTSGAITELGRAMAEFPLHPRVSRMLIEADKFQAVYQAAIIAALIQEQPIFVARPGKDVEEKRNELFNTEESDLFVQLRAWGFARNRKYNKPECARVGIHAAGARRIEQHVMQILRIAEQQGLNTKAEPVDDELLYHCILAGYADHVAVRIDSGSMQYRMMNNRRGRLSDKSIVHDAQIVVAISVREIERAGGELDVCLENATAIDPGWLKMLYAHEFSTAVKCRYDAVSKSVLAEEICRFRNLDVEVKRLPEPPVEEAARILADEVLAGRLKLKKWNAEVDQWIDRLTYSCYAHPELGWTPFAEDDRRCVIEQICLGKIRYKQIKDADVWPVVRDWLGEANCSALDHYAPRRYKLPSGRTVKVRYPNGKSAVIAARIQELFEVKGAIHLPSDPSPVTVEILAPNFRPVQITGNVGNFWKEQYPAVRSELKQRYPKHDWPEFNS